VVLRRVSSKYSLPIHIPPTAIHSYKVIEIIIIQGWYSMPNSNKWIQFLLPVRNENNLNMNPRKTPRDDENRVSSSQFTPFIRSRSKYIHSFIHSSIAYRSLLGPALFFSFVIFFNQTVGFLVRGISPSQGRYLHTEQYKHRINAHINIHAFE
jgi:hypothetical protein